MERKIGEIFEYEGNWYQCVVAIQGCRECSFRTQDYCTRHSECISTERSDKTSVIFKKLEKVGGTYAHNSVIVQKYRIRATPVIMPNEPYMYFNAIDNTIEIEIKQNKEDMLNTETLWYGPDKKEAKSLKLSNLKPFSLEAAKAGKPVCTRDGRKARIICFDRKGKLPIVALVESNSKEEAFYYLNCGKGNEEIEKDYDLMMLPEKRIGWININKDAGLFKSKEEAERGCMENYVPAKVEFEI